MARADARKEVTDARIAAREAQQRADEAERVYRAAVRDLLALREQIQQQIDSNPLPPAPPNYDDMRQEILGAQPHLLGAFLKGMKSKDGTTLEDKFEDFQRRSFVAHQRRDSDALGRYSGSSYGRWKDRSLEMQRKIDTAKFSSQAVVMDRQREGQDYER